MRWVMSFGLCVVMGCAVGSESVDGNEKPPLAMHELQIKDFEEQLARSRQRQNELYALKVVTQYTLDMALGNEPADLREALGDQMFEQIQVIQLSKKAYHPQSFGGELQRLFAVQATIRGKQERAEE